MPDWSVRGATVKFGEPVLGEAAKEQGFRPGQSHNAFLIFKMDSFALHIPMQVGIKHVDAVKKRMGVVFEDMSPRQLSVMQQLVSAYVSGELTSAEDIIHVVERNNFVKPRTIPSEGAVSWERRLQLFFRKLIVFLVALLLFGYLVLSIYERNFIVEASNAYVDAGSFMVSTPAGGTVFYTDIDQGAQVKQGAPLALIQSRTGTITTLESPCDCVMHQTLAAHGNHVNEGDSVLSLVQNGALMYVTAFMPYEVARDMYEGQPAQVAVGGAAVRLNGTVDYISHVAATRDGLYKLRIVTKDPIDSSLLGTPAHVTIDTFR